MLFEFFNTVRPFSWKSFTLYCTLIIGVLKGQNIETSTVPLTKEKTGLGIRSLLFGQIARFLWAKEQNSDSFFSKRELRSSLL